MKASVFLVKRYNRENMKNEYICIHEQEREYGFSLQATSQNETVHHINLTVF